jgi:N-methylhydantoinase A
LIVGVDAVSLETFGEATGSEAKADRHRKAYFGDAELDTPIFLGAQLRAGAVIEGPAIIEEPTSTLVVYPGGFARVSAGGRYILTPPTEEGRA